MRVVIFFLYLCFHQLGGGNYLYAETHHSSICYSLSPNLAKNEQEQFTNQASLIIEDDDIDLDEECFSTDDVKDGGTNKYFLGKYNLGDSWYLRHSCLFILSHYYKCFKILPRFCGQSNPIYITQRVLRI